MALTFGTLLSSQGTDASFVLTLAGFPPGASLRSCVSDSIRLFRVRFPVEAGLAFPLSSSSLSRFPFPAVPTLPEPVRTVSGTNLNSSGR
ncbi:hypothetical protein EAO72_36300 [Streptomyces sp. or43]|nr:hypothetical protein EAO72_36300 [Streptomyces sp. or43]